MSVLPSKVVLVVIGQIGAGKSELCRRVAEATGARHFDIEDLRRTCSRVHAAASIADRLANAANEHPVALECTGAASDFEDVLDGLRQRGWRCFVVLLECSVETARNRVRQRGWKPPKAGGTWERHLGWTQSRLRLVPADLTLASDRRSAGALASTVRLAWRKACVAQERPGQAPNPRELSFSQLSCFDVCPLAYRFRYVDQIAGRAESAPMFLGTRLHEALAWLYGNVGRDPASDEVLAWFNERLAETLPGDTSAALRRELQSCGERALALHYESVFGHEKPRTIAVEKPVHLTLRDGSVFVGRVDRLALDPTGTVEVIDYKLSARGSTSRPRTPDWLQSAAYSAAVLKELKLDVVIARRTILETGEEQRFAVAEDDVRRIGLALHRWQRRLTATDTFRANAGPHCASCEFNPVCTHAAVPLSARAVRTHGANTDGANIC